jgi:hypothetical protein
MAAISGKNEGAGPHKSTNPQETQVIHKTQRSPEELGELMLEEFLDESIPDLVEQLLQVHHDQSREWPALSTRPSTVRMREMLGSIAAECFDAFRPHRVDIPKAMKGLEDVMRAPCDVIPVEQYIAAVTHRLLSYELERQVTQVKEAA